MCSSPVFNGFVLLSFSFLCIIVSGYYCLYFTFGYCFLCLLSDSFSLHLWTIHMKSIMRVEWDNGNSELWLLKSMKNWVEKTNVLFCSNYNVSTHFRHLRKVVFSVKGKWHSPNTTPVMANGFPYFNLARGHDIDNLHLVMWLVVLWVKP